MITNLIRTYTPYAVAWIVGGLASLGIDVTDEQQLMLVGLIGTIAGALYHLIAHALEQRYPWASRLLGSTKQPLYADSRDVTKATKG